jgi:hypothetical protein
MEPGRRKVTEVMETFQKQVEIFARYDSKASEGIHESASETRI